MKLDVPTTLLGLSLLAGAIVGCDDGSDTPDSIPTFDASRTGELIACNEGSFDPEQINAVLADYPELAEELGMTEVRSCEQADAYFTAYSDYIESFPSEEEDLASDDDKPADFRVAAADGTNLATNGILELTGGCTGVLIHTRALITAAHCVDQWSGGARNFWKTNFTIKNFGGGSFTGTVRINVHPNYTGESYGGGLDDGDDIAVIKLTSGSFGFPNSHRHRLYTGYMSTIGWMKAFGRGASSNNGGWGTLRYMWYKPNWTGPYHFLMNASDPSRICRGDSGGPIRDFTPGGWAVVAGLNTSIQVNNVNVDQCARWDGKQRAVRIQHKVRWIDDMLGGGDSDDCTAFNDNGWTYERCW